MGYFSTGGRTDACATGVFTLQPDANAVQYDCDRKAVADSSSKTCTYQNVPIEQYEFDIFPGSKCTLMFKYDDKKENFVEI